MNDLNFKHCANKKSYATNMHEREHVREDRKNYLKENALLEVIDFFWMQFQKIV